LLEGAHSGVEYFTLGLVDALLRFEPNNEYVLFCTEAAAATIAGRLLENVHVVSRGTGRGGRLGRIAWEQVYLPRLADQHKLDVLHCPGYICPLVADVPIVLTIHDTIALDHPRWCRWENAAYYRLLMRRCIARADIIHTVSHATAQRIARHVPGAREKTKVVYPGIEESFRRASTQDRLETVRRAYRLPESFILYVGNFEPKKNIDGILSAYEHLHNLMGSPPALVLVGRKAWGLAPQVESHLTALEQQSRVHIVRNAARQDLPTIYSLASVFLFPSHYEGFGFPPLEAMACGTPVVTSARGALAETMRDAAIIVDPNTPDQIALAICKLLVDQLLSDQCVVSGLRTTDRFRWSATARKLADCYGPAARTS
jgi:glycosyltransferase involved in cell wall biosynthesis